MEIISPIHGKMIYEENEIITFERGIPGFEYLKKFIIKEVGEDSPFNILQSIEDKDIGFIVISPFMIIDSYEIKLSEEILKNLRIKKEEEVVLYSLVTLNERVENITANLKAPLVINITNQKGEQYILDKEKYKIKTKVFNDL
ncbi:flagellar assembly protein FliW [Clostridium sp. Sa3CUN1]|uniref:Flagellar assembly factor FliW n=1 Tax=Clostridium gallinarum TaxID=2762246 RepID=A0ABR8Q7K1_9CLOT|nr:flagellar assembly protein FliW [Clostridium gallinarum]MBD7916350.1 flagellar assembly protein FliW [Clostridium gallinarum]